MVINFLLLLLFYLKEADNDQQGQIGNGDERANVEEGKNRVLLSESHTKYLLHAFVGFSV